MEILTIIKKILADTYRCLRNVELSKNPAGREVRLLLFKYLQEQVQSTITQINNVDKVPNDI